MQFYFAVKFKNGWKLFEFDKVKRFKNVEVVPIAFINLTNAKAEVYRLNSKLIKTINF